jgi:hypothetical protein
MDFSYKYSIYTVAPNIGCAVRKFSVHEAPASTVSVSKEMPLNAVKLPNLAEE